jgi:hypothetical protein
LENLHYSAIIAFPSQFVVIDLYRRVERQAHRNPSNLVANAKVLIPDSRLGLEEYKLNVYEKFT